MLILIVHKVNEVFGGMYNWNQHCNFSEA